MNAGAQNVMPHGWKAAARKRCRQIARDTPNGPVSYQDGAFLAGLLARHPDAAAKIGSGIAWISVGPVPGYPGTRGFAVHRTDGSSTDFSWVECITESSYRTRVLSAMREAIIPQKLAFKQAQDNAGLLQCAVTGAYLTWNDAHVDHLPPGFTALADAFAASSVTAGEGYAAIPLMPSADGMLGRPLRPDWAAAWTAYHWRYARLQILSVPAHLALTRERGPR